MRTTEQRFRLYMDVFLYSTYAHSRAGFVLTRLKNGALVSPTNPAPGVVRDFFSYGRYMVLWREFPMGQPEAPAAMLGLQGLRGNMRDGRSASVNLALLAGASEQRLLTSAALDVLGNWNAFQSKIIGWLSVGGAAGYSLDAGAFLAWLENCPPPSALKRCCGLFSYPARLLSAASADKPRKTERERLRFAVCTCVWEQARQSLGFSEDWNKRPHQVVTASFFQENFVHPSPLWITRSEK